MRYFLPTLFLSILFTGCGATKGYEGPTLPPEQISQIRFSQSADIEMRSRLIDKKPVRSSGVDVLPDVHSFYLDSLVLGDPTKCTIHTSFDTYGYNSCREDNTWCDCYNYQTVHKTCIHPAWSATCAGTFSSQPGKKYIFSVELLADAIRSSVLVSGKGKPIPIGSCRRGPRKWKRKEERLGTGINTAIMNGVNSCGY